MKAVLKALALLVASAAVLTVVVFIWIGSRGISARADPGRIETVVARTMRRLAIPRNDGNRENPVAATPEVMAAGRAHYADHCAACHANDGSGETQIGLGLYPKPPDMRLPATQSLTDGELFYIIENGVRLTGMPAWSTGTPEGEEASWHLVHFIRRLPKLTAEEIAEMEGLNPRPPAEIRQDIDAERFLRGDDPAPAPGAGAAPHVH
jgi:mono/diheme cytochrome c family protein